MKRPTRKEPIKTIRPQKRNRRTPEQMIRDLEAEIARVKERAERQKVKRDPALKHVTAAVRSIAKALDATTDAATSKALGEAQATLKAVLALTDAATGMPGATAKSAAVQVEPDAVLTYLQNNPRSSGEQVADAMGTDTKTLRPVMKRLIADGQVAAKGKGRGMRYAGA